MTTLTATKSDTTASTQVFEIGVDVSVSGDVATWSYTYDGKTTSQLTLDVWPGVAFIELTLASSAMYVTNPINWYSAQRQPVPTPEQVSVDRASTVLTTIVDNNTQSGTDVPDKLHFLITVDVKGTTYTSPDPTIVNHKPIT